MLKFLLTFFLCIFFIRSSYAQPQIQNKIWCSCQLTDSKKTVTETLVLNSAVSPHPYAWGSHYGTYAFTGINEISFRENGIGVIKIYYTNLFDNGNYLTLVETNALNEKTVIHFVLCSPYLK